MSRQIDTTMLDRIDRWASERCGNTAYIYLTDGETKETRWSFKELRQRALGIADTLAQQASVGERAIMLYPSGLDFIAAFLGCLYAGVIPVPTTVPRKSRYLDKFSTVVRDCDAKLLLTTAATGASLSWLRAAEATASIAWLATDEVPSIDREPRHRARPDDLAFLQYTSGSTGDPKGVMVTHANLWSNERAVEAACSHDEATIFAGWLPLFHDMGLIGNVLQPLYLGVTCVLMAPGHFIQKPVRWLRAISRFRATTSGAPNFAYDLCVAKQKPEDIDVLDLSSWRVAFSGAEPVRAATLDAFAKAFEPAGFREQSFYPCYGMAESTLFATGGKAGQPEYLDVDSAALTDGRGVEVSAGSGKTIVSCGWPWLEHEFAIVDPNTTKRCPEGIVGEIWLRGPSIAAGYWCRAEATQETFKARTADDAGDETRTYLRTGDLGFIREGRLYVTGRIKESIIIRGKNHYPHDLERTAERSHPALALGGGAAFAVAAEGEADDELVIAHELARRTNEVDLMEVKRSIREAVAEEHGVRVRDVVLLEPGAIPKTSSGKTQRVLCRDSYLKGRKQRASISVRDGFSASKRES